MTAPEPNAEAVLLAGSPSGTPTLPEPERERWEPLRIGLLNLYRFDEEEFRFRRGRLLLRGNNGTGKSRVLALTLPFLLDGELGAHRMEPDGDSAKKPEWNLLLGRHEDRLGYAWIEFGRREEGVTRYLTLGCGMRAARGRGIAGRWFFTTDQRVGEELSLRAEGGHALVRNRLEEAVAGRGQVHDTAREYRAEVNRHLFGLGERRYEALLDLLVQLRRPQLSRRLDEGVLSGALTEALPPLPDAVLEDLADAFGALEADRAELDSYQAAAEAADTFLESYRRYAAVAVRRRAGEVTRRHSEYEGTQRKLRDAERKRSEAETEVERLEEERGRAREEEARLGEEVRTLETSDAMDRARELERAREEAGHARKAAEEAEGDRERAQASEADQQERARQADERAKEARTGVDEAARRAAEAAAEARLDREHEALLSEHELPGEPAPEAIDAARNAAAEAADRRARALARLQDLSREADEARAELSRARSRRDDAAARLDAAREGEREAAAARSRAVAEAAEAYRAWAERLQEAQAEDPEDVRWALEAWGEGGDGRSPLERAVAAAVDAARGRLTRDRASLAERRDAAREECRRLAEEREEVEAARHLPPPPSRTRSMEERAGRAGAPLWRVVEPVDGLEPGALAGYEAALEAAGLLDAWVTPEGDLLDPLENDAVLVGSDDPPAPGGGLAAILRPAPDPDEPDVGSVREAALSGVLARLGAGEGPGEAWFAPDGQFRLGPLQGHWSKAAAEYLGTEARDAARRRRLDELDRCLAEADEALARIDGEVEALDARERTLDAERERAPGDQAVRDALAATSAAARRVGEARDELAGVDREVTEARGIAQEKEGTLRDAARDLGLEDHVEDLARLERALASYREALAALWPTLQGLADRVREGERARADLEKARTELEELTGRAEEARRRASRAEVRRDTLEASAGKEVEDVLARLDEAKRALQEADSRVRAVEAAWHEADAGARVAAREAEHHRETLEEHHERRAEAIRTLGRAVRAGLLAVAHPDLAEHEPAGGEAPTDGTGADDPEDWAPDRAVRVARAIDRVLEETPADDDTWRRVEQSITGRYSELESALLAQSLRPEASLEDQLYLVRVPFQGELRTLPALHRLLVDEVGHRQQLLSAKEREILENHLVGDVAAHLHRLIHDGEQWVRDVNEELAGMPTSTGMQLRFAWKPRDDGPPGLKEARRRLLAHHAGWSPEEREEVGAFLQDRIQEEREKDETGTWREHLAAALDYRRWHTFVVERRQDGEWKPLTRRTHGTGSGGEKALALTVPQFAAAAAHYRSADRGAPRLILLDEAFVGIDSDMRAKCMGLIEQFDLDLVMTSEREWGCYPTISGLAIAQLATRPGIDAVGVTRWIWDGRDRRPADG